MTNTISRVLIANRGEIARRIIRSAHAMGIETVAIYADDDANEPFVLEADQAVSLQGSSSLETYLDAAKVLDIAKRVGADAVHPGYGFLSENAAFADAVKAAGITWVGPSAEAIRGMGDKLSSKRLMAEAGVPTLPSAEIHAKADVKKLAKDIGYPVLVKASAGGGGKGMRVVEKAGELQDAVESARREAGTSFGDDTIFLERWLTSSRHVEIQVLGDEAGNVIHCFERECSIQRRHQKIIEEAPSPAVDADLRKKMGVAAVAAAKAVSYTSAGTVEFLLDGDDFWFLEMNTRLQVEHPVTEEITGLDLVREQFLIAQGENLSVSQDDLTINGHAIEARLYAEDPDNDFLPVSGPVLLWEPSTFAEARFDSGIESGSVVGIEFDPLLAKIIVHAPTRREAALRLARVLETTRIQGLTTNRDFLASVLRNEAFLAGDTTTDFIERINPARTAGLRHLDVVEASIAAAMTAQVDRRRAVKVNANIRTGFRNSFMPPETVTYAYGEDEIQVDYRSQRDDSFNIHSDGIDYSVTINSREGNGIVLEIDGIRRAFTVTSDVDRWHVHGPSGQVDLTELPRFPVRDLTLNAAGLVAPMPGKVLDIFGKVGDEVEKGQVLLILEAMKMEHRIESPRSSTIAEIKVEVGEQVVNGAMLIVLAEEEDSEEEAA